MRMDSFNKLMEFIMTDYEYGEIMLDQMSQEDEDWAYIEDHYSQQEDDYDINEYYDSLADYYECELNFG